MREPTIERHNQIFQQISTDELLKFGFPSYSQINDFAAALGMTPTEYIAKLRNFKR